MSAERQDLTVGDVARSSAWRWNLPIFEDGMIAEGVIEFVHRDLRIQAREPGVYVRPGADLVLLKDATARVFDSTVKRA